MKMLMKLLLFDKWVAMITVVALYIGAAFLVLVGATNLILYIIDYVSLSLYDLSNSKREMRDAVVLSANFISIIDVYLLAIVFYLLAVGLYKLLIGPIETFEWMKIDNLDDLKEKISKTIILFLSGTFLRIVTQSKDATNTLFIGIAVSCICLMLIFYVKALKNNNHNNNHNNTNNTKI